ncbi:putative sodium-dependent multivitamin transporter [Copidosoma floridanum]|uniref:putative sodium-dependent multivitamin transporter n=1 Tax=Copidosoma floridanum TaxID=29053 RepID=UPI000C6F558C|nr:putative sodium-dependent multivitamin transporter [Copidosoma floridanum]
MEGMTLTWPDYIVILGTMCVSTGIGIYYKFTGNRQRTTAEYFTANKSMGTLPVGIALMVTFISAVALLGISSDSYTHGTMYVVFYIPFLLVVPIVCYGYYPIFYKLQLTSVFEYLKLRFGNFARSTTSWANWVQLLLYSGICLYAPALALEVTAGLPQLWSIIALGVVCAFYSSIGGMKAVLVTDVFQGFLMLAAVFMVIITAAWNVGGLGEIWRIAKEGGRLEINNFSLNPTERHSWWSLTFGGMTVLLSMNGVSQVQVQRLMTVKNLHSARKAMVINMIIHNLFGIATCFAGLAIYSRYHDCDPKASGRITSNDQLMPFYIMDTLSQFPGLPGLFISGIFSAALSTISASLNSLAAITLEDHVKPIYEKCWKRSISEPLMMKIGKSLAFAYGLVCIGIALCGQFLGSVLQASLSINGCIGGTVLGIFTLGMLVESANEPGAVFGLLSTLVFVMWISFGTPRPTPAELPASITGCEFNITSTPFNGISNFDGITREDDDNSTEDSAYFYLYRISYMWYSVIGFVGTFVVGFVASCIYRCFVAADDNEKKRLDPDLFFPVIASRIRHRHQMQQS